MDVSFWLTAKKPVRDAAKEMMAQPLKGRKYFTAQELAAQYGSNSDAVKDILNFAEKHRLSVSYSGEDLRQVTLNVPVVDVENLFGVELATYKGPNGASYRGREGFISLSREDLSGDAIQNIVGVFGLDNRSQARRFAEPVERGVKDPSLQNTGQSSNGSQAVESPASAAEALGRLQKRHPPLDSL